MMEFIKNPILCGMIITILVPVITVIAFEIWEKITD
jgi:uncharacterized membrane protein